MGRVELWCLTKLSFMDGEINDHNLTGVPEDYSNEAIKISMN